MPCTALPKHLQNDPHAEGDGTDHDNGAQRWWSRCWTAFGPNATETIGWVGIPIPWTRHRIPLFPLPAKWRRFPAVIAAYNIPRMMGQNDKPVFYEWDLVNRFIFFRNEFEFTNDDTGEKFKAGPSPIQYEMFSWALTWPLHFVITYAWNRNGKVRRIFFRMGARWDSLDDYHVFPAIFLGGSTN